jgi:hypothetical protein
LSSIKQQKEPHPYKFIVELTGRQEEKELAVLFEKLLEELRDFLPILPGGGNFSQRRFAEGFYYAAAIAHRSIGIGNNHSYFGGHEQPL